MRNDRHRRARTWQARKRKRQRRGRRWRLQRRGLPSLAAESRANFSSARSARSSASKVISPPRLRRSTPSRSVKASSTSSRCSIPPARRLRRPPPGSACVAAHVQPRAVQRYPRRCAAASARSSASIAGSRGRAFDIQSITQVTANELRDLRTRHARRPPAQTAHPRSPHSGGRRLAPRTHQAQLLAAARHRLAAASPQPPRRSTPA